jgi:hypothetical protein
MGKSPPFTNIGGAFTFESDDLFSPNGLAMGEKGCLAG